MTTCDDNDDLPPDLLRALRNPDVEVPGEAEALEAEVATRFGVSKSLVAQIVRGELWKD